MTRHVDMDGIYVPPLLIEVRRVSWLEWWWEVSGGPYGLFSESGIALTRKRALNAARRHLRREERRAVWTSERIELPS